MATKNIITGRFWTLLCSKVMFLYLRSGKNSVVRNNHWRNSPGLHPKISKVCQSMKRLNTCIFRNECQYEFEVYYISIGYVLQIIRTWNYLQGKHNIFFVRLGTKMVLRSKRNYNKNTGRKTRRKNSDKREEINLLLYLIKCKLYE